MLVIITHGVCTRVRNILQKGNSKNYKSKHQNEENMYIHSHEHILSMYKDKKCSEKPKLVKDYGVK